MGGGDPKRVRVYSYCCSLRPPEAGRRRTPDSELFPMPKECLSKRIMVVEGIAPREVEYIPQWNIRDRGLPVLLWMAYLFTDCPAPYLGKLLPPRNLNGPP